MLEAILDGIAVIGLLFLYMIGYWPKQESSVRFVTDKQRYPNHTPYVGPEYNRNDREVQS